ncbi:MAG: FAD-dependent monooxygenase [Chloroflexota bacterium]
MPSHVPVLVVGSGPTGLIMASQLLRRGVSCRLIDRLEQPVTTSRSFTIHARTLELMTQLGLHDKFRAHGLPTYAMTYHFMGKEETPAVDFTELDSPYPFCLNINQNETEAILRDYFASVGGTIEWNYQLQSLEQTDDGVTCTLVNRATNAAETVEADWVLGCDGFYSTVRRFMDIPFDGEEYTGMEFKMMDVPVEGFEPSTDSIHYYMTKEHLLLFAKLVGENFRVLISDMGGQKTETVREAFQAVTDVHFGGSVRIGEPSWATNFKIARRKVDTFRQKHVFLAGDSAHVNSPAGGQGMNVSMQDAFNLGWKLAEVINGEANAGLLDTYEAERNPIAAQLLAGTHYLNSIIMGHGNNMEDRLALTKVENWNLKAVSQIAGISYTYRESIHPLLAKTWDVPLALEAYPGDRVPYYELGDGKSIFDCFNHPDHTLLFILSETATPETLHTYAGQAAKLIAAFKMPIAVRFIVPASMAYQTDNANVLVDTNHSQDQASAFVDSVYLVRPDLYIAEGCPATEIEAMQEAMHTLYTLR